MFATPAIALESGHPFLRGSVHRQGAVPSWQKLIILCQRRAEVNLVEQLQLMYFKAKAALGLIQFYHSLSIITYCINEILPIT